MYYWLLLLLVFIIIGGFVFCSFIRRGCLLFGHSHQLQQSSLMFAAGVERPSTEQGAIRLFGHFRVSFRAF